MKSFKNKESLKTMMVEETVAHRKGDRVIQGTYTYGSAGEWKGCAVGCAIHSLNKKLNKNYSHSDHSVYEIELGIPEWLARLEDTLFEGLTTEKSKMWPENFIRAIPVGVDLNPVKYQFCIYLLKQNIKSVKTLNINEDIRKQVIDACKKVMQVHKIALDTGKWDDSAADSAADSARSAYSAARSARSAAHEKHSKELLALLKNCK
jgi:hypothetical protein